MSTVQGITRLALGFVVIGACGTATDDRPATLPYITEAILVPSCAEAQCHSTFTQAAPANAFEGYVFDSVASTRKSMNDHGLIIPGDAQGSYLMSVLTRSKKRMPYDAPLPDADLALISMWILDGAPGL